MLVLLPFTNIYIDNSLDCNNCGTVNTRKFMFFPSVKEIRTCTKTKYIQKQRIVSIKLLLPTALYINSVITLLTVLVVTIIADLFSYLRSCFCHKWGYLSRTLRKNLTEKIQTYLGNLSRHSLNAVVNPPNRNAVLFVYVHVTI